MMISALYIEESVRDHPRTRALQARFPNIPHILCERYSEIFNRHGQDFRTQKKQPALILAEKRDRKVLPTPPGYGIGGEANYYFSHILNCLYDCRYCFLQGLYQSAHYVLFLNFEDFQAQIDRLLDEHPAKDGPVYFFSGYDGDSFALESLTGFVREHLDFFRSRPRAILELRTKSLKANDMTKHPPFSNAVVAFSLTPAIISQAYEMGVPPLRKRLEVMRRLAHQGWPIGLRFDPMIVHEGYRQNYEELLEEVFRHVTPEQVHSVTLGVMRFPRAMHKKLTRLYPEEALLAAALTDTDTTGQVATGEDNHTPLEWFGQRIRHYIPPDKIFTC